VRQGGETLVSEPRQDLGATLAYEDSRYAKDGGYIRSASRASFIRWIDWQGTEALESGSPIVCFTRRSHGFPGW